MKTHFQYKHFCFFYFFDFKIKLSEAFFNESFKQKLLKDSNVSPNFLMKELQSEALKWTKISRKDWIDKATLSCLIRENNQTETKTSDTCEWNRGTKDGP